MGYSIGVKLCCTPDLFFMKTALLLYGATDLGPPHFSADLLWKSGFRAPDPFPLAVIGGEAYLLLSPLEIERGEKEAKNCRLVSLFEYQNRSPGKKEAGGIVLFLKDKGVDRLQIPSSFPFELGKYLEKEFALEIKKSPVFPERTRKNKKEIAAIEEVQSAAEYAVAKLREFLARCVVRSDKIFAGEEAVTSEMLRSLLENKVREKGFLALDTIAASGIQAADPHCLGWGPVWARAPLVVDIFPLSPATHYYTDMTRTFFKGEPSSSWLKMYKAVLKAQERALDMVKAGTDGRKIQEAAEKSFAAAGFATNLSSRPMEGFIHGLGHGVGLDIHEAPRIGKTPEILEEGNVVTIEPGLYYHREREDIPAGGIRLEDLVVVERDGCRNLTQMPKSLEWSVIP